MKAEYLIAEFCLSQCGATDFASEPFCLISSTVYQGIRIH